MMSPLMGAPPFLDSLQLPPSRQLKGVAGELHARDEGRNGGDDQHRHGHGREAQQQGLGGGRKTRRSRGSNA